MRLEFGNEPVFESLKEFRKAETTWENIPVRRVAHRKVWRKEYI